MNDSEILRDLIRGYDQRIQERDAALADQRARIRRLNAFMVALRGKLRAYRQAHIQATEDIRDLTRRVDRLSRAGEGFCYRCDDDQGRGENST